MLHRMEREYCKICILAITYHLFLTLAVNEATTRGMTSIHHNGKAILVSQLAQTLLINRITSKVDWYNSLEGALG